MSIYYPYSIGRVQAVEIIDGNPDYSLSHFFDIPIQLNVIAGSVFALNSTIEWHLLRPQTAFMLKNSSIGQNNQDLEISHEEVWLKTQIGTDDPINLLMQPRY